MRVLASHEFSNDKAIKVLLLDKDDQQRVGAPGPDVFVLARIDGERSKDTFLRPDEALIIIKLLSEALYKAVTGYEIA